MKIGITFMALDLRPNAKRKSKDRRKKQMN
jgi:hypothetical protein